MTDFTNDDGQTPVGSDQQPSGLYRVCALMRQAADVLEATLSTLPALPVAMPLPLQDRARNTRRYLHTDWPRAMARDAVAEASPVFDTPAFRDVYRPGDTIEVYAGAGEGYKRVSRALCLPAYKIGTTGRGQIPARFRQHKAERYASFWWDGDRYVEDPDFSDQFPGLITTTLRLSPASPVRATRNSVMVTLPDKMTAFEFELALRASLAHCALHTFIASADGLRHCAMLNVDPSVGIRMTGYNFGDARRMSPADEIYTLRPMIDGDALLAIAERIVLEHMGLVSSSTTDKDTK